jgi:uncharacterized membrane protein YraQ (UPF0718 family)
MLDPITTIADFFLRAFLHSWPYLLVTIPLAVAVRMSGASKYISRVFRARPVIAVLLATAVGAFSPLCSCGVIPVVAALLIGGVPLGPVMSFWIASPSMDPEAFFLSVATIGWELAIWRLASTLALSLGAGFVTLFLEQRGWFGDQVLRTRQPVTSPPNTWELLKTGWRRLTDGMVVSTRLGFVAGGGQATASACGCGTDSGAISVPLPAQEAAVPEASSGCGGSGACSGAAAPPSFWRQLLEQVWDATTMVVKFMTLTFVLEALIELYIPTEWVVRLLGYQSQWAIPAAALFGVPVYTSNLTALPMIGGLLAQGMNPAAALAFLISGPTTTLPAMAAVWGIASRRVFALYISFSLVGALVAGYAYSLAHVLF